MWRRALVCGVVMTLLLGLAVTAGQAQKPQIRIWLLRTYIPDANKALEDVIADWGKQHNVEPVIQYFTFDDIAIKYTAAIETNTTPDVGMVQTVEPARFRGMGRILDVTDTVEEAIGQSGGVLSSAIPATVFDGRWYAVPYAYITDMLFVRTDLFKKAGITKYPATWEEVREAARVIKARKVMDYPLGQSWNRSADGYGVFQALLYSLGGGWADARGNYTGFKSAEMRKAMAWATEIYQKDNTVPPDAMAWTGFGNNEAYLTGKIAMTFNGPSIYYVLEKENRPILKDTVMLLKPAGAKGRNHDVFLTSYVVFNNARDVKQAKDLIKWILAPDNYKKVMYKSFGQLVPPFAKARTDPYWQKNESYKNLLKAPEHARVPGFPGPITAAAAEVVASNVLTDMVARVLVDKWPIDKALDEADQRGREIYAKVPKR
jgi:multiple sugar transport system substrate-binding protein